MLVIGLGIGLIIAGIIALVKGKLSLTKTRAVQGVPARLLGVALMTPLPISFVVVMVYTLMNVDPNDQQQMNQWGQDNDMKLTLIMAGVEIGLAVLIILIAAFLAKPLPKGDKRSSRREVDGYDDYKDGPRRRRSSENDVDENDRPRRRDDLEDRAR